MADQNRPAKEEKQRQAKVKKALKKVSELWIVLL
jgi:hypothetical protein